MLIVKNLALFVIFFLLIKRPNFRPSPKGRGNSLLPLGEGLGMRGKLADIHSPNEKKPD